MNSSMRLSLQPTPEQREQLLALQRQFALACNAIAPIVQETRIWNRVALHHLAYRKIREAFPNIGSQMACNAIYAVSRTARFVFQSPQSPFHHLLLNEQPLPLLQFLDSTPVYFDRHTLSIRQGTASMYTLDGRMRFQLMLSPTQEQAFHEQKLLEAVLQRTPEGFELVFRFGASEADEAAARLQAKGHAANEKAAHSGNALPSYITVQEAA